MCPSYLESLEDNIKVDKDKCVFCGKCADRCILDNIRLNLSPCRRHCPMGVNAQGYIQLILRGREQDARAMVREKLPFPEVICRVCDHPCESNCARVEKDGKPVSIRELKRYLFDSPEGRERAVPAKAAPSGKKIAVLGAGPAGLVAAHDLALQGHEVTLFDAAEAPGGLLRGGIPAFRLPESTVDAELAALPELGVHMRMNARVGKDLPLGSIMSRYDAVVLATGLDRGKSLGVPGENLDGVLAGLPFLRAARAGKAPRLSGRVLVIGGGNMAVDAAMVALRQGAGEVIMVSLEGADEMPAFANELEQARAEGVRFRHSCGVAEIRGENGKAVGAGLKRCTSVFDVCGCFTPQFDAAVDFLDASFVITAIGQERDASILEGSGLTMDDVLKADPLSKRCGQSNVFTAGDISGAGSVIKAMASGREAAESASRHVLGKHLKFGRGHAGPVLTDFAIKDERGSDAARKEPARRAFKGAGDYEPVDAPFTTEEARKEASRCLSCGGPCGKHRTCWFCLPCEVECPEKALWVDIPYLLR